MSPSWIRRRDHAPSTRRPKGHRTYQVLYRRGGRDYPVETGGSFPTEREARLRRDLIAGWLATGLNPKDELARIAAAPIKVRDLNDWAAAFKATRIDVSASTTGQDAAALTHLTRRFGDRLPDTIDTAELQELVTELADTLAPITLHTYLVKWRMLLDYTGIDPNPASDKHLRLPRIEHDEINPPTADHILAVLSIVPPKLRLPLITLEQTGMRIGELDSLAWGDVDEHASKFRLRAGNTKTSRARWVQVPEWVMAEITATVPPEDRAETRPVFVGFTADRARRAIARACPLAGVPVFTPHDLRHRRATIWHHEGLPVRVQMERGGWTKSSIPLEVYSHLMPLTEAPIDALKELLVVAG